MFRCPTIDERVFAASLHHPTRWDGLRVPFPCDWHAQLPSAAGTLSLSLVVRSFFFFFLFLFGSLSFVSSIACRSCSLSPFILAPRIPWLRCLVRVRISPSCDVLGVFAPQLHVWGIGRVQRRRHPPSSLLFSFFFFFFLRWGWGGTRLGHPWNGIGPTHPPVCLFHFLFLFLSIPCHADRSLSLSPLLLSHPTKSHRRWRPPVHEERETTRRREACGRKQGASHPHPHKHGMAPLDVDDAVDHVDERDVGKVRACQTTRRGGKGRNDAPANQENCTCPVVPWKPTPSYPMGEERNRKRNQPTTSCAHARSRIRNKQNRTTTRTVPCIEQTKRNETKLEQHASMGPWQRRKRSQTHPRNRNGRKRS